MLYSPPCKENGLKSLEPKYFLGLRAVKDFFQVVFYFPSIFTTFSSTAKTIDISGLEGILRSVTFHFFGYSKSTHIPPPNRVIILYIYLGVLNGYFFVSLSISNLIIKSKVSS